MSYWLVNLFTVIEVGGNLKQQKWLMRWENKQTNKHGPDLSQQGFKTKHPCKSRNQKREPNENSLEHNQGKDAWTQETTTKHEWQDPDTDSANPSKSSCMIRLNTVLP